MIPFSAFCNLLVSYPLYLQISLRIKRSNSNLNLQTDYKNQWFKYVDHVNRYSFKSRIRENSFLLKVHVRLDIDHFMILVKTLILNFITD